MKILIIDDSPEALAIARARLAKEQVTLQCASSGEEGMRLVRGENPDLVLLDIDMPDCSGFDLCRQMKADPMLCTIPVIFLTGSATPEDKVKGLDLGAVDYVTKPFDAFELRARVRAALRTKRLQDILIECASVDPLTELPNRRALMERLHQEWARCERRQGQFSLIMVDIDHFKQVNDTYGHGAGDQVLRQVAQTLSDQCRSVDLPARYGGEEFAIIVPDEAASGALHLAERCRQAIECLRMPIGQNVIQATASFGVAESTHAASAENILQKSDDALYKAKETGRNRVECADASRQETVTG